MSKSILGRLAVFLTLWLGASLIMVANFGCGDPGRDDPKVYPVKGTVKFKNGKPLVQGFVSFKGNNPDEVINSFTEADGSFALSTVLAKSKRKLPGVPAGDYQVTVTLPMGQDQSGGGSMDLPTKYTVKPQDDNNFAITIESPRK